MQTTSEQTSMETTQAAGGTTAMMEETTSRTMDQGSSGNEVTVGGFVVDAPNNGPEVTVPQASVSRDDARKYLDQVRPIADNTVRDISDLVQPDVQMKNGKLSLGVEVGSLQKALNSVQNGRDRLQKLDPPKELKPINQQLISAYDRAQPAYKDIIEAADSGDPGKLSKAVQDDLPRIERFNSEVSAIVQDLEQAAGNQ